MSAVGRLPLWLKGTEHLLPRFCLALSTSEQLPRITRRILARFTHGRPTSRTRPASYAACPRARTNLAAPALVCAPSRSFGGEGADSTELGVKEPSAA